MNDIVLRDQLISISLAHNLIEKKKFLIKYLLNNVSYAMEKLPLASNFDAYLAAFFLFTIL
jgi:hypothetical protein